MVVRDLNPVTEGHVLIVPTNHVQSWFDMVPDQAAHMNTLLWGARARLKQAFPEITGFTVGINDGDVAGQTVQHAHMHLIPRREGDAVDLVGGACPVVPGWARYGPQR